MSEHERFPQAYQKTEASMGRRWPCRLEIQMEAKRDDEDRRKGGCRAGKTALRRKCLSGRHHRPAPRAPDAHVRVKRRQHHEPAILEARRRLGMFVIEESKQSGLLLCRRSGPGYRRACTELSRSTNKIYQSPERMRATHTGTVRRAGSGRSWARG
jgi:hypothetical protein